MLELKEKPIDKSLDHDDKIHACKPGSSGGVPLGTILITLCGLKKPLIAPNPQLLNCQECIFKLRSYGFNL